MLQAIGQIIISNTTEVGIVLMKSNSINSLPPVSFPGKLLSYLLQRYKTFNGSKESGMVIVPTELIPGNGTKLKAIVNEVAVIISLGFAAYIRFMQSEKNNSGDYSGDINGREYTIADVRNLKIKIFN